MMTSIPFSLHPTTLLRKQIKTLKSLELLDEHFHKKDVYAEIDNEPYILSQTPTVTKNNSDARYEYKMDFVAGRFVLENIYIHDVELKSTNIYFSGTINQYADFLNRSLAYCNIGYRVIVDNGVTSESKFFSFTDESISAGLQEGYKQFEIPYYHVGTEIHFGFCEAKITDVFRYGANNALLSIQKSNVGNHIINRCTGVGSEENIPYYYPNEHPLGIVDTYLNNDISNELIVDKHLYADNVKNGTELTLVEDVIECFTPPLSLYSKKSFDEMKSNSVDGRGNSKNTSAYEIIRWGIGAHLKNDSTWFCFPLALIEDSAAYSEQVINNYKYLQGELDLCYYKDTNYLIEPLWFSEECYTYSILTKIDREKYRGKKIVPNVEHDAKRFFEGRYYILAYNEKGLLIAKEVSEFLVDDMLDDYLICVVQLTQAPRSTLAINYKVVLRLETPLTIGYWKNESGQVVELGKYGLKYDSPIIGDKITFATREGSLIPYQNNLMPPRYRLKEDVYYNAESNTYELPGGDGYYEFSFPYSPNDIREHKETFDFIKPSIEYVKYTNEDNVELPVNMFVEFAYDENDSDGIDHSTNEYIHPYFYGRLRPLGFNLFNSGNEKGEMTFSMTSGDCGGCNFVVGVDEETQKNVVQVNEDGTIAYENGKVKFGEPQDVQNDTTNNYVWIALKKDASTYSNIRPNATYNYKPNACSSTDSTDGDTFVIININLPKEYILHAERELEREIIAYMKENNDEKFKFSIKFSRIFLAENKRITDALNENSTINVEYNGVVKPLYVTSYTYKSTSDSALPEIIVELDEELKFSDSYLKQALSNIEHSILESVSNIDFYKQGINHFIRKDVEDTANEKIHFAKGATFGDNKVAKIDGQGNAELVSQIIRQYISTPKFVDGFAGTGFKLWLDENGKSNLTIDNITARETFRVFEMLVTKLRSVNGGLFVSAANGTIKEVVEGDDYYDIVLENDNTFMVGDYMRCQVMSGLQQMTYWVEISSINGSKCRVLKSEFGDVMPLAGQDVVLCGSRNENRQNAIHISATDDGQPRIEILNGIGESNKSGNNFDGCVRARLGNLDGIIDSAFGNKPLSGDGLFSDNVYLKGEFVFKRTGQNVETVFEIQDGKIKSGIAQTQAEAIKGKTLLYNASFIDGLNGWLTSNEDSVYFSGNSLLFSGSSLLTQSVKISNEPIFDNVFFLTINNGWIEQGNYFFVNKPAFDSSKFYPLYFSANMRCRTAGTLTVKLAKTGHTTTIATQDYEEGQIYGYGRSAHDFKAFVVKKPVSSGDVLVIEDDKIYNITKQETFVHEYIDTTSFAVLEILQEDDLPILTKDIQPNNEFFEVNRELMWNGTGDFYLSFTGEADFYGLTIYTEKTEVRHKTFFEMSDRLIEFGARQLNSDGTISKESGIVVKPNASGIYAIDGDGNTAKIGVYTEDGSGVIKLSADKIFLDGKITANGKVEIVDGKIKAQEAELINANFLSGKDTNDFYLKINNQGLQSILSSDLGDRLYMQLSTAQVTSGVPTFAPRLLFTNGYTSSNESIVCNTILMYNQFYINEQTNPDEMGLTKYQNRRLSATCGSLQITKNIDGTTTMVAITPDYIQLNGYKITVGEDGSIKTKKV